MNIIFMGTPDYATEILREILKNNINVLAVFTQPDKPVGRKQVLTPPSVKQFLLENYPNVPIFQPNNLKDVATHEQIRSYKPDFIVVAAYGQILPKGVLDIAPCINLHASILPKFRGASPIQSAILSGESESGVTTMLMDVGLDTGDILEISRTSLADKTAGELFDELAKMAGILAVSTLKNFNKITPQKQNEAQATICKKIKKEMGLFNFNQNSSEIYNKFRAFTPWPGIFLDSGLKILSLKIGDLSGRVGEILQIEKDNFQVATIDGSVKIFTLQEPGKKAVKADEFINGKRLKIGDLLW